MTVMVVSRNRTRPVLYIISSLTLAIGVFAWLLAHVTWRDVFDLIRSIHLPLLGLFFVLSLGMHTVRTLRYRLVLASVGQAPNFFRLFLAVLVRSLCVDLLPARSGELVYIYLLRTRLGVELGAATASFALAFLFDLMALAPLLVVAFLLAGLDAALSPALLIGAGMVLLLLAILALQLLPTALRLAFGACRWLPAPLARFRQWSRRFLAATHRQIRRARAQGIATPLFGLSLGVRLFKYSALYILLLAMLHPQGYTLQSLPFPKVFLGLCAAEMAASLPVSGLAGFGAYEGAWAGVFMLLGFPATMAKASSISHHLFTQAYGYLLGGIAAVWLLALPVSSLPPQPARPPPKA